MQERPLLTIVIPVFNSREILIDLHKRLQGSVASFGEYEIIFVNDNSTDGSWNILKDLSEGDVRTKCVNLRKNVGCDGAIIAGLQFSKGEIVVVMDDDLQHAPEDIEKLIAHFYVGYDVVYANFFSKNQSIQKNIGSWINGKVAEVVVGKPKSVYLSPFKVISRSIAEEIIKYKGPFPYVDGLILQITDSISQVSVDHHERSIGKGNYGLFKSFKIWMNLATGFSILPLRFVSVIGISIAILTAIFGGWLIVWKVFFGVAPEGWVSNLVIVLFLGSVQLLSLGVIGEYLGRSYLSLSGKPQHTIRDLVNFEESE